MELQWRLLKNLYENPKSPYHFGSPRKLYKGAKQIDNNISLSTVYDFLRRSKVYTSHRPPIKSYLRKKTIVKGLNDQWQLDLIDMQKLKRHNNGTRYLLSIIDCFSRQAYLEPLKNKTAEETLNGFKRALLKAKTKPNIIQFDEGSEFKRGFRSYLIEKNIKYFSSHQDLKAAIVERWNRTIKDKIYRYLTAKNTLRYIDVLPDIVNSYNRSYHRTLGIEPINVTKQNEKEIWDKLYRNYIYETDANFKYNIGDSVKIIKYKKTFQKGYLEQWKDEIFKIAFRLKTKPVTYILIDENEDLLKGSFYSEELNKLEGV